jgi:hypothetical protein
MLQAFISRHNKSEKNVKGVNNPSLLEEMEPDHFLVPILHCPMGIVDKFLETLITWIYLKVDGSWVDNTSAKVASSI